LPTLALPPMAMITARASRSAIPPQRTPKRGARSGAQPRLDSLDLRGTSLKA
jgi:hypothetical protein